MVLFGALSLNARAVWDSLFISHPEIKRMKIGLMSDTHGDLENMKKAARFMVEKGKVELIVHLGDDYRDAEALNGMKVKIVKVPGVYCREYEDSAVSNRLVMELGGWKTLITHTPTSHSNDLPQDPRPEELMRTAAVRVIIYGHTHAPKAVQEGGFIFINPGHLKTGDRRGHQPSFALLDFMPEALEVEIIDLKTGKTVEKKSFPRKARAPEAPF